MSGETTMQAKAANAWGDAMPDWIGELADAAEKLGLNACAKRLGYSPSVVSQAIAAKYAGDLTRVETKVRGALMGETVTCPVLGEIGRNQCLDWQGKPRAVTNAVRTRVYRACRSGCPHSRLKPEGGTC